MNKANAFRKVEICKNTSGTNTMEIKLNGEGHTAASVITERLEGMTEFAAYKITHPTDNFVTIRIKTTENLETVFKKYCVRC